MDTQISLQEDLRQGVRGGCGCAGGPAGAGQECDAHEAKTPEAFGRRLYKIHTAISHAIEAHYQAMAGEVNAEKLRMLVEEVDANTVRVGNFIISQAKT